MSALHTPGPWAVSTLRTTSGICHQIGPFPWRDGQSNYACIYVDGAFTHSGAKAVCAELEANAKLIAAAPELLAALVALSGNIGAASLARNPHGKKLREDAAAAIAKAIGAAA